MTDTLETRLLAAHARGDIDALVGLYTEAADLAETAKNIDAACFYLTHAFVFALESGSPDAKRLNARLVGYGRAHPIPF